VRAADDPLDHPDGAHGVRFQERGDLGLPDFEPYQDDLLPRLRAWFVPQSLALVSRLLPRPEAEGAEPADPAALMSDAADHR
jgi:hypothetical protein